MFRLVRLFGKRILEPGSGGIERKSKATNDEVLLSHEKPEKGKPDLRRIVGLCFSSLESENEKLRVKYRNSRVSFWFQRGRRPVCG